MDHRTDVAGSGSSSGASRWAAAGRPRARPASSAGWSTGRPRATLTTTDPGASARSTTPPTSPRVAAVRGGHDQRVGAVAGGREPVGAVHPVDAGGHPPPGVAADPHLVRPERCEPERHRGAERAQAEDHPPDVPELAEVGAHHRRSRCWPARSGRRLAWASRHATTNSKMGNALIPTRWSQ